MKERLNDKRLKLEFQCDKDVRLAIEELQDVFDRCQQEKSTSLADIEAISGIDKSSLSKIVNGRKPNLTLMTIARVARAMDRKMVLGFPELEKAMIKANYICYPELQNDWTVRVGRPTEFSEFGHREEDGQSTFSRRVTRKSIRNQASESVGAG